MNSKLLVVATYPRMDFYFMTFSLSRPKEFAVYYSILQSSSVVYYVVYPSIKNTQRKLLRWRRREGKGLFGGYK